MSADDLLNWMTVAALGGLMALLVLVVALATVNPEAERPPSHGRE